jgi:uncharacterized membrane protein YkoI
MKITEADLPQSIKSSISSNYTDYKIDSIEVIEENGAIIYQLEIEKGWNDEKEIVFDVDGKILRENRD